MRSSHKRLCIVLALIPLLTLSGCVKLAFVPIRVISAPGNALFHAKHGPSGDFGITNAVLVSQGPDVLLFSFRAKKSEYQPLFKLNLASRQLTQLTFGERFDTSLALSPDSRYVLFSSFARHDGEKDERSYIYILDTGDDSVRRLTALTTNERDPVWYPDRPVWSPDGSQVAFLSSEALHIVNLDGTGLKRLTPPSWMIRFPEFLENGRKLFFWKADWYGNTSPVGPVTFHHHMPYIVDISTTELDAIRFTDPLYFLKSSDVSPDGSLVVSDSLYMSSGDIIYLTLREPFKLDAFITPEFPWPPREVPGAVNDGQVDQPSRFSDQGPYFTFLAFSDDTPRFLFLVRPGSLIYESSTINRDAKLLFKLEGSVVHAHYVRGSERALAIVRISHIASEIFFYGAHLITISSGEVVRINPDLEGDATILLNGEPVYATPPENETGASS